jgi:hypothetical protein
MNTGPLYSKEMLCSSCAWPRNSDFHLSTNDIKAFASRLACSKRDRDIKTNRHLPVNFATQNVRRSRNRCSGPCPGDAHEDLPPVTYVPSINLQGHRSSQPPPEKASSKNFKPSPTLVLFAALVHPSAMSGKRDPESWHPPMSSVAVANAPSWTSTSPLLVTSH